jgi:adenylate cyclase
MADPPDFAAAGLLDGLEDEGARAARLELLQQLHDAGVPLDELRQAAHEDRLALLPVELLFARELRYTAREVAERAGLPLEFLMRTQQAFGMSVSDPDERTFSEEGLKAAERAARFRAAGLPEEGMIEISRVLGVSMARLAEAMRALVAEAVRPAAESEHDLGLRYAALARDLVPELGPLMESALMAHMVDQIRTDAVSRAELAGEALPGARPVAVAFADLVGFTRLGESRPVDELGAVAGRLAEMAQGVAVHPVRLVKTIGDAAMLVSPHVPPLLDAALGLVDAADAEGDEFPQLKAGVAAGPALNRGGDWYGHAVNLASRVTGIARPGSVLCTREVRDAAGDNGYRWSATRERRLKGISEPMRLFRVRRDEAGADSGG